MSLLELPEAVALLEEAKVPLEIVTDLPRELTPFLQRYLPLFYRQEQRELAGVVLEGKLGGLDRKTCEPIAYRAGRERKPVQNFVGAGKWNDDVVMAELRVHVGEDLGDPDGVLICDGSAFAKKGTESCGVARQWCGRLGKIDNCQVGVYVGYASRLGQALVDRRLYLPQDWAEDAAKRHKCHVPEDVVFAEKWRIALDLLERCHELPHAWVVGDDEFGRVTEFRRTLRRREQQYVLDVPANTLIRELHRIDGRLPPFERVEVWAARQPRERWRKIKKKSGEKGELKVWALTARVQTKAENGRVGSAERVLVMRPVDHQAEVCYALSNAWEASLAKLVEVQGQRQLVEQLFQEGKGEVGLAHYEVRSWVGWHHHMTLSILALWFLNLQRAVWGEKCTGANGAPTPTHHDRGVDQGPRSRQHRRRDQQHSAA